MTVRALFFAHFQDFVGARERDLSLPASADVRELARELTALYPRLGDLLQHGRVAVNAEFADAGSPLRDGDEVAFMPPMSGGSGIGEES